jgi:hypothetical protein
MGSKKRYPLVRVGGSMVDPNRGRIEFACDPEMIMAVARTAEGVGLSMSAFIRLCIANSLTAQSFQLLRRRDEEHPNTRIKRSK